MEAQDNQVALPLRPHTIFGVCEAIGEDFGFNPVFLRIPLAAMVFVQPVVGDRRLFRAWRGGARVAPAVPEGQARCSGASAVERSPRQRTRRAGESG